MPELVKLTTEGKVLVSLEHFYHQQKSRDNIVFTAESFRWRPRICSSSLHYFTAFKRHLVSLIYYYDLCGVIKYVFHRLYLRPAIV